MPVKVDRVNRVVNGNKWWFGRLPPDNASLTWGARAILRRIVIEEGKGKKKTIKTQLQIEFVPGRSQYEPSGHPSYGFLRNYLLETVAPQLEKILAGAYNDTEWGREAVRALTEYKHNGADAPEAVRQDHGICHWEGIFSGEYVYLCAWIDESENWDAQSPTTAE